MVRRRGVRGGGDDRGAGGDRGHGPGEVSKGIREFGIREPWDPSSPDRTALDLDHRWYESLVGKEFRGEDRDLRPESNVVPGDESRDRLVHEIGQQVRGDRGRNADRRDVEGLGSKVLGIEAVETEAGAEGQAWCRRAFLADARRQDQRDRLRCRNAPEVHVAAAEDVRQERVVRGEGVVRGVGGPADRGGDGLDRRGGVDGGGGRVRPLGIEFAVEVGIQVLGDDPDTGEAAAPGDANAIFEFFFAENAPKVPSANDANTKDTIKAVDLF